MGFAFVPEHVCRRSDISPSARHLWTVLASYADKRGYCFPSQETLAADMGCTTRQIRNLVRELDQADLLVHTTSRLGCSYTLLRFHRE